MASSDLKTTTLPARTNSWIWLCLIGIGWVFGYLMASAVKDLQAGSRRSEFEGRIWSRIDAMESRLSTSEQSLADIQARAPQEFPPKIWLEDTFRPLVERVRAIESSR